MLSAVSIYLLSDLGIKSNMQLSFYASPHLIAGTALSTHLHDNPLFWPAAAVLLHQVLRGLADLGVQEAADGRNSRAFVAEGHLAAGRLHQLVRQRRLLHDERVVVLLPEWGGGGGSVGDRVLSDRSVSDI